MTRTEAKKLALISVQVERFFSGHFLSIACVPAVVGLKFKYAGEVYEIVQVIANVDVIRAIRRRELALNYPELADKLWELTKDGPTKGRHDSRR